MKFPTPGLLSGSGVIFFLIPDPSKNLKSRKGMDPKVQGDRKAASPAADLVAPAGAKSHC